MYSNGPNMPLAQRLSMLNRAYNKDLGPTVVGHGQQKEAAAAIQASNQENFAQGSAGDFTQKTTTDEQKSHKFDIKDSKHQAMGCGGDEPQQYKSKLTKTPLKGILVRSETQQQPPRPQTKKTKAGGHSATQGTSGPSKKQQPVAVHGKGSSVLVASNYAAPATKITAAGAKQKNGKGSFGLSASSSPLKKSRVDVKEGSSFLAAATPMKIPENSPQSRASITSISTQIHDSIGKGTSLQHAAPPKTHPDAFSSMWQCSTPLQKSAAAAITSIFSKCHSSDVEGPSQSSDPLKTPNTSVLARTQCESGTSATQIDSSDSYPNGTTKDVIKCPISPGGMFTLTTPLQLMPTIPLKRRSIEAIKPPVQRDVVDRPRVPPQDDWNVHVKFTNKRNRAPKSSPKENSSKASIKKNRTKVAPESVNLTQTAPWNVVAGGSWIVSPAATEAATPVRRPVVAATSAQTSATSSRPWSSASTSAPTAAPGKPPRPPKIRSDRALVCTPPTSPPGPAPVVFTSWNLVARRSPNKPTAHKEETKSSPPRSYTTLPAKAKGEEVSLAAATRSAAKEEPMKPLAAATRPAAKEEPQFGPKSVVRGAPNRASWNLFEGPVWNEAIADMQRRRSTDACSSGTTTRMSSQGSSSPQDAETGGKSPPDHATLAQKNSTSAVLQRTKTSTSIQSQTDETEFDSDDSDQEERSGSEEWSEEQEEQELEEGSMPQHPLNNEWTMWYLEPDRTKTWEETLHEIISFKTVENFWSLYHHIKTPSEIKIGTDYCMFKAGIRPMWEDEANVHGGRWIVSFPKSANNELNFYWEFSLLSLIGEFCEHSPDLCGAVANIRQTSDKIALWTADGSNEKGILEIGQQLRKGLPTEGDYVLQYQLHSDCMTQQGSDIKALYTL